MLSKTIISRSRRVKSKLSKNLERLFKEGKCRECSVVVTRMDFAKILGKFTKVKIQFENSNTTAKGKSSYLKSKLKSNENGYICDDDYSTKGNSKRRKITDSIHSNAEKNILKDKNILKKPFKDRNSNYNRKVTNNLKLKQYHVVFSTPNTSKNDVSKPNITLTKLLSKIDETLLPSDEWSIDYSPKPTIEEAADDKVYDRIAAELEDLMNNGKTTLKTENKPDEFPSIMDILNDNTPVDSKLADKDNTVEVKTNLESNDVEAILLGEPTSEKETIEPTHTKVEESDVSKLIADVAQFDTLQPSETTNTEQDSESSDIINPHSPSILDEALQKGIEEHLPPEPQNFDDTTKETEAKDQSTEGTEKSTDEKKEMKNGSETSEQLKQNNVKDENTEDKSKSSQSEGNEGSQSSNINKLFPNVEAITEVIFKKNVNGECYTTVTCQKDLMYCIQIDGKSVQLLGAPKFITTSDDLQILLQIVNESDLKSFHVLQ